MELKEAPGRMRLSLESVHEFLRNADPALIAQQKYACGCFWFRRKEAAA